MGQLYEYDAIELAVILGQKPIITPADIATAPTRQPARQEPKRFSGPGDVAAAPTVDPHH